ncbi:RNA polymerase II transcriptional coactivator [Sabethes cyaneus]|uniref:RNA polymerase II transcriptional coactivator n=1 Tax=Sabethes cyaneus TaxID=53552 RepID=UPI00221E31F4|nr:RNA polymerase II transcriptional coactivator [Sabethes cyaneus]XP_053688079.1 RNA polymerase II transcriptional coactivator [Sabethes cyaneus]XP_053688080.1 RNA polymerase II transcriptional coactivator [Sabethes cyaneus]
MPKNKKKEDTSDSDSGPDDRTPVKKSKTDEDAKSSTNKSGEPEWQLDRNRKITVREFKNKVYVDVREFYEKDGKELPGKKGISLNVSQWKKLLECADEVNEAIKKF